MTQDGFLNKIKIYIISIITIVLCGEMYFFPFQGAFRFSVGVVALSIILLFYDDLNEFYLALFTAIAVFLLRSVIFSFDGDYSLLDLFKLNIPASIYYMSYVTFFYIFKIKLFKEIPTRTIYLLSIIDSSSNIIEALIRNNLNTNLMRYILIIAVARSAIIYVIYYLFRRKELLIRKNEHEKRYNQLNALISNIQAEIFYLSKSTSDIEAVMSKAYTLYENTKGNQEINHLALDVAREVHEIKKDYHRVVTGFKSYVDNFDFKKTMALKEISSIIESNLNRYIEYQRKDIEVKIKFYTNIQVSNYYYLFTIINNLITNAIDAIQNNGEIYVEAKSIKGNLILKVIDNGPGIDSEIKPYIFNPGFTTK
ncbi:MAG: sensor histidine kinase [Tissierella sp.]|nr:sensor histidine kinase [Tissierella sp.]